MCSPSRASFLTGTYPSRHGVTLTLTEGDLYPDPANLKATLREGAALAVSGEAPRGTLARSFARGALRLGPKGGGEPELPADIPTLGSRLREAGYTRRLQGQVAPDDAPRRTRRLGSGGRRAPGTRLRLPRLGAARRGREHRSGGLRRRQCRRLAGGLRRGLRPPGRALPRRRRPARAVLSHRLARQPARRARLPVVLCDRRLRARAVRGPADRPAGDRRRGPARQADRARDAEARADVVPRAAAHSRGAARLRALLRATCTRSSTRRSADCWRRSATPPIRARCAREP